MARTESASGNVLLSDLDLYEKKKETCRSFLFFHPVGEKESQREEKKKKRKGRLLARRGTKGPESLLTKGAAAYVSIPEEEKKGERAVDLAENGKKKKKKNNYGAQWLEKLSKELRTKP